MSKLKWIQNKVYCIKMTYVCNKIIYFVYMHIVCVFVNAISWCAVYHVYSSYLPT